MKMKSLSVPELRLEFQQLKQEVHGKPLVYLDNAATSLKPRAVVERLSQYYSSEVANIHRGSHFFGDQGTSFYEAARDTVRTFLGAASVDEVVFTRGTTEGLNLVAHSLGYGLLKAGDEILLTEMEHHSNIVPWQLLAEQRGLKLRFARVTDQGEIDLDDFGANLRSGRVKVASFAHTSNALGTVNPVSEICKMARQAGVYSVVDAAQAVTMGPLSVGDLGCDFLVFSGHKCFAPTGIGVLYGTAELLRALPPYQGGGAMISEVSTKASTYLPPPHRFEAGTPHIAGAIGLATAIEFMKGVDWRSAGRHEAKLVALAESEIRNLGGVRVIGESSSRVNILSFVMNQLHAADVGQILDREGIAIRSGHHCCQPLMKRFGIQGTLRASFSIFNTEDDVKALVAGLRKAKEMLT